MNNLFSALKAGDLAKAQKAYASSGLPPMGANNTSPLGRLYTALRNEDLKSAQQAALDMQGRKSNKNTVRNLSGVQLVAELTNEQIKNKGNMVF